MTSLLAALLALAAPAWAAPQKAKSAPAAAVPAAVSTAAVAASNFSLGVVLFGRLVDAAVELFGPLASFDPYLVEWHRRDKLDRPSGTAGDLARRILAAHPAKRRIADGTAGYKYLIKGGAFANWTLLFRSATG